jgi:hypothetical protein
MAVNLGEDRLGYESTASVAQGLAVVVVLLVVTATVPL